MGCLICGGGTDEASTDLCPTHLYALDNVKEAFEVWANAYRGLQPVDFLKRVAKLQGTGRKVKEVADFLRQHPEKWKH